ncbi:MAG TPA: methylated-DNA--[protein]-cysteine S-methyltransferase [Blastocatellia bacterium]|nr:methylated-DNA--[protein]-cysteine S-methyltransferase [Blastocatellia bacterium]
MTLDRLKTPIGEAILGFDPEGRLRVLNWQDSEARMMRQLGSQYGNRVTVGAGRGPKATLQALKEYFDGDVTAIDAIECESIGTEFQRSVWAALRTIPAGQTLSYGALATKLGTPRAVRAVGRANGTNPISLVVPCHRVIGADGSLTGYGGGLDRKRWLLNHEGAKFVDRDTPTLW